MGTYNPFTNINTNMFNQENTEKSIDFDKLLKMANNDDPDAQYEVGNCYLNGIEVEKDEKRAYQWFLKSAQHNNMYGLNGVGSCYRFGRGVKQDLDIAIEWYLKSAELGCVFAMNNLGSCYRDLEDLENHYVISFEWYKKAADLGDEYALNNVGSCYRYGRGVDIDYNEAIEWYKKAAKLNNLFAINNIGSCYRELGDYVESAKWYEKAALAGNSYAQNNLALYYWLGNGVEVDIEKAKKLFIQSATNGNGYAFGNLGKLSFEQGDYANAFMYLTDSENSNDSPIDNAYYLGYLYHNGLGCKMDLSLAKKYYCLAVERGYSCSYSIEMVKRDIELEKYYQEGRKKGKDNNIFGYQLDVFAKDYAREKLAKNSVNGIHEFIDTLIKNNIDGSERRIAIKNEVEKDFGEVWQDLEEGSKTAIVTGIYIYSTFVEMGYNEYQLMDFAPVINELAKSFEIELKNFFIIGFLKYLKKQNIDFHEFINEAAKKQISILNEEIIVKNGKVEKRYSYADENNMESMNFSLGELYFLVTNGQKENFVNGYIYDKNIIKGYKSRKSLLTGEFINKHIVNYFDELLDDSIFSKKNRKNEIANYLIDLANDVKTIRLKRNAGSHANSMTIDEAEVCADFMIKVKKIIYNFIIKIKPEYRKGYNI